MVIYKGVNRHCHIPKPKPEPATPFEANSPIISTFVIVIIGNFSDEFYYCYYHRQRTWTAAVVINYLENTCLNTINQYYGDKTIAKYDFRTTWLF